jgi:hypothetical protein
MKITQEHYKILRNEISMLPSDEVSQHKKALLSDPRVKDLDKRFRWDLMYRAGLNKWVCETLYPYMNDTHLDTALKSVVKDLGI